MSPFAHALRQLRFERGLRQSELAELLGYERSYVSALENDLKQAPPADFVERACVVLGLDVSNAERLRTARAQSCRRYEVPPGVVKEAFCFVHDLFARLGRLSAPQLLGLRTILELGDLQSITAQTDGRIRRRDRGQNKEAAM